MQKITNILWRCLAIVIGLSITICDGRNTLLGAAEAGFTEDVITTLAGIVVVATAALPVSVWAFTKQNKTYGILCFLVFLIAWSVSYGFSVNRMGSNRDNVAENFNRANLVGILAEENRLDAKAKLEKAKATLAREAVSGKGPIWKEAKNNLDQAKLDYAEAEAKVLKAGPTKRSATFEQTGYLVYLLPFVAQATGVVFMLIGFGAMNKNSLEAKKDVVQELLNQPPLIDPYRQSEDRVYNFLKKCSNDGEWRTTYRKVQEATGVNIALVKEHLTDLHYRRKIVIEGSTKGRGTWGRLLEANLLVET